MNPVEPGGDGETGQPVAELRELEYQTSAGFAGKVRRRIQRRTTAAQVVSYSWFLPGAALLELVNLLGHFIRSWGKGQES